MRCRSTAGSYWSATWISCPPLARCRVARVVASRALPVIKLDKVFRQSEGSLVAENARRIRLGDTNLELNNRDFQFIPAPDFDRAADLLVMRYLEEVRKYGVDNVALLTPYREKTATGARTINKRLRDIVNPASPDKPELVIGQRLFRLGDKVMQNKNTEEVSNGDIGYTPGSSRWTTLSPWRWISGTAGWCSIRR